MIRRLCKVGRDEREWEAGSGDLMLPSRKLDTSVLQLGHGSLSRSFDVALAALLVQRPLLGQVHLLLPQRLLLLQPCQDPHLLNVLLPALLPLPQLHTCTTIQP